MVRKGDDAKAHKELNQLGGDAGGDKEMDTGKAESALSKVQLNSSLLHTIPLPHLPPSQRNRWLAGGMQQPPLADPSIPPRASMHELTSRTHVMLFCALAIRIAHACWQLASAQEAEAKAKAERERELQKVKVDPKDLELVMKGEVPQRPHPRP